MELCLGPSLYNWKREDFTNLYRRVAESPVDTVYIGEVICTKRAGLSIDQIERLAAELTDRGKRVILSTPAIVAGPQELDYIEKILKLPYPVEANDMSVFNLAGGRKELVAGPHIEVYNPVGVEFLMEQGISRVVFPVELPFETIEDCVSKTGIFAEVVAHGHLPLAFSWRCYTLRAEGLKRSDCKNQCSLWPEGMELKTLEGERVFSINGTSVMSAKALCLVELLPQMEAAGIGAVRIYPHHRHTIETIEIYKGVIDGTLSPIDAMKGLRSLYEEDFVNGWFYGKAGKEYQTTTLEGR